MQREVREGGEVEKRLDEADKNEMSDFIFSSPTSFLVLPPLCSKEKVSRKRNLRMSYTHVLMKAIFSIGRRRKDRETTKINRLLVSESCFVFRKLGAIKLLSLMHLASVLTVI